MADPYDCPGAYRKAQLHAHTSNSLDVLEKLPVEEAVLRYKRAGYSFVALTDHDRVTDFAALNGPDFLVVAGEEKTLPLLCWPLGRHLLRLGIGADGHAELIAPAHLNWKGNLGTARWYLDDLLQMGGYRLIEVYNGKSHSLLDFWLWSRVLAERGHRDPVWGIAVDDSDNAEPLDQGWVMVKTGDVTAGSLFRALNNGSFYSTTGPIADFRVEGGVIRVTTEGGAWVRFIDARNEVVAVFRGDNGEYAPFGDEGFVRVEVVSASEGAAWSQPFFLIPAD